MYLFLNVNDIKCHDFKTIEYVGLRVTREGKRIHVVKMEW